MKQVKKSIHINAPAAKIFDYLTHSENLPEIWPNMVEVTNVKRSADATHSFDWLFKMAGMPFRGHCETVKVTLNKYVELENKTGIPSVFRWTYQGGNGATEVALEIDYEVPIPLLGRLAEAVLVKINEREVETLLANLRDRMEAAEVVAQPLAATTTEKHA